MMELSNERVESILEKETQKTEEAKTILRAVYTRYMRLYEQYFADIDALNNDKIAELKRYHEETLSLVKYYYMDIPQDTCKALNEFEEKYSSLLLGPSWHMYLFKSYDEFKDENRYSDMSEKDMKAEYSKRAMKAFYESMDYAFREGFGTGSKTVENVVTGIAGLLFGKKDK